MPLFGNYYYSKTVPFSADFQKMQWGIRKMFHWINSESMEIGTLCYVYELLFHISP